VSQISESDVSFFEEHRAYNDLIDTTRSYLGPHSFVNFTARQKVPDDRGKYTGRYSVTTESKHQKKKCQKPSRSKIHRGKYIIESMDQQKAIFSITLNDERLTAKLSQNLPSSSNIEFCLDSLGDR